MIFRPMLVPTLLTVPALIILVFLGNWQMQRLAWKENLIAQVEAGLASDAISLPAPDVWATLDIEALRYTPATVTGRFVHDSEAHIYMQSLDSQPGYHVVTPFELASGGFVLVDRGFVPINRKNADTRPQGQIEGDTTLRGILVTPDEANSFTPDPDLTQNIWYHRPIRQLADVAEIAPVFPMMLDADATPNPGGLPVGGQTRVVLNNPHLGYAMTWYGLAATLIIIWLAFHISRGRLGLRG
ncbi:SURF1 family protein [Pyruvatibacter sp.]|uniref:SURF1 family protein n=1 Tax=Pyruvatibacter sp. TaxID=1981328 RepID=UPI0032EDDACF